MSTLVNISSAPPASTALPPHPLEPLSADEVRAAVELLKQNGKVTPTTRFVSVALKEPRQVARPRQSRIGTASRRLARRSPCSSTTPPTPATRRRSR